MAVYRQIYMEHTTNCVVKTQSFLVLKLTVHIITTGLSFFCGEGPRSRSYRRTAALRLIVQPCDEDEEKDDQFFSFLQVMGHRWNDSDRGKTKYSGENPVPVPIRPPQIPHHSIVICATNHHAPALEFESQCS